MDKKIRKFVKDAVRVAPKISNKGELFELRNGLASRYPQTRKDAIKKIIQQMNVGKDVSSLFSDVLKNIATADIEQKKLVYLYIINYAQTHPELCILSVNTFITDAQDPNPLIRCMAIRTMSMISVDKIVGHVEGPLRRTLQDDNPYVRKTAVLCVAKFFKLNRDLCLELEMITGLICALDDSNPMVVANTIAALTEIYETENDAVPFSSLMQSHMKQFLSVLNECTEWARITILGAVSQYETKDSIEAQDIIYRVTPHLQHVNAAVVIAAVKVLVKNLNFLSPDSQKHSLDKISTALVSLMSTPPEMQFVVLRNIRILLQKYPELLAKELVIFYVKFNDPLYIKLEKLDIMVRLVSVSNTKQCELLLNELHEYAMDFEPEFVSKSIQCISQLTIKFIQNSDKKNIAKFFGKTIDIICSLLQDREIFQDECLISICDLTRCVPSLSKSLVSIISSWNDAESRLVSDYGKCNYIWLLGQYQFPNAEEKLQQFIDTFHQQGRLTQLSILLTTVKLGKLIKNSSLNKVLNLVTTETSDIDIRDMALIYSRCLSLPNANDILNELCKAHLPKLTNTLETFSPELLSILLNELSTLSSIYYKPLSQFRPYDLNNNSNQKTDVLTYEENSNGDILLDLEESTNDTNTKVMQTAKYGGSLAELKGLFDFNADASLIKPIHELLL